MDIAMDAFYLGTTRETDEPFLFDGNDLTTHGVIVGMTGSGKTALAFNHLEEALLNGIPALILDPKGEMGSLMLVFPDFDPADFEPWVDPGEAAEKGRTVEEHAGAEAAKHQARMTNAGISPERMQRLVDATGITIYTPGSTAGVPLNILGSLDATGLDWDTETEAIRDEIESFVSSLLVLAGIDSDPVSGREHILLATLIEHFWRQGNDLDLATLVGQIPKPPFRKLGVFELDEFFPEKDRTKLALQLNGLLASPSFASWLQGEPLDIEAMLGGDPTKAAIVYLAHLTEEERQFVVTLVLSKLITWMRAQSGSEGLRALGLLDEAFGYAPPTAEPPSKKPILTILKQGRAFGVGLVLATQNPVDLDYKAISNSGTWWIGRLQTDNNRRRMLQAMEDGAAGDFDATIAGLGKREFLLNAVKAKEPVVFDARRSMSYRTGPMTKEQVSKLMADQKPTDVPPAPVAPQPVADDAVAVAPTLVEGRRAVYLDPGAPWAGAVGADPTSTHYEPAMAVTVDLLYDDTSAGVNHGEQYEAVIYPLAPTLDPATVIAVDHDDRDFLDDPPAPGASYQATEARIDTARFWSTLESQLKNHLVANRTVTIHKNPALKLYSRVGESEADFKARAAEAAETAADAEIVKLEKRYAGRVDRAKAAISKAENRVRDLEAEAAAKGQDELLSGAGDLLGTLLGGKSRSNPLSQAAKRRAATAKAQARVDAAREQVSEELIDLAELEDELAAEIIAIGDASTDRAGDIIAVDIPLEKSDVTVTDAKLVWVPREPAS